MQQNEEIVNESQLSFETKPKQERYHFLEGE